MLPQRFWFWAAISTAVVACSISPMVYLGSWKAGALANYISSVATLVATQQLAEGMREARVMVDLSGTRSAS